MQDGGVWFDGRRRAPFLPGRAEQDEWRIAVPELFDFDFADAGEGQVQVGGNLPLREVASLSNFVDSLAKSH